MRYAAPKRGSVVAIGPTRPGSEVVYNVVVRLFLTLLAVVSCLALPGHAADRGAPLLHQRIDVPAELCHPDGYAGDIRMGDLDGDGAVDFVVYRSAEDGMKPCFLGAFDAAGRTLWKHGDPTGEQPARPGSVTLYDVDGDGRDEIVCFFVDENKPTPRDRKRPGLMSNIVVQVRDGRTGAVLREASPPEITNRHGKGANWVHHRILVANLRGTDRPRDFVVKLGDTVVAFTDTLTVLWTYRIRWNEYSRCSSYIPAVGDIDGDGRDEVLGGYYLLNSDGTPRWAKRLGRHMDSVAIVPWDDGKMRAICSGFGHVVDADGNVVVKLGEKVVPHGQEVRVADFLAGSPGPEMIIRNEGHTPSAIVVDNTGRVVHRFELNDSPNHTGMEAVHWDGPDAPAVLYNGGTLFNGDGTPRATLPDLPPPIGDRKMGWYHCVPADVCGDAREEVVVYNPWDRHVWVHTPAPYDRDAFSGYRAGPRQYNVRLMD